MGLSDLAIGMSKALDEWEKGLHSLEVDVTTALASLELPIEEAVAALPNLMAVRHTALTAMQWVEFHMTMMCQKIARLEDRKGRREWYDPLCLWLPSVLRRHRLSSLIRRYQEELKTVTPRVHELSRLEVDCKAGFEEVVNRIGTRMSTDEKTSRKVWKWIKENGPTIASVAASILLMVTTGIPIDLNVLVLAGVVVVPAFPTPRDTHNS